MKRENANTLANSILIVFIIICIIIISNLLRTDETTYSKKTPRTIENSITTSENDKVDNSSKIMNNQLNQTNQNIYKEELNINTNNSEEYVIDKYYYQQINSIAKSMYASIKQNIDKLKTGEETIELEIKEKGAETNFQTAWDALCMDLPEIFYVDTNNINIQTSTITNWLGKVKYEYNIIPQPGKKYFNNTWNNEADVQNAINLVETTANSIIYNATGSTYDKVKYIHDYIINNVSYNQEKDANNSNIYGALINKKAICEGYSDTLKYLLDKLNIPCVCIYGNGIGDDGETEFHAWNYVMMDDGKWYAIDCTWDDPIVIGNGKLPEESKHRYFLKGSADFFTSHKEDPDVSGTGQSFIYPELSTSNYNR